MPCTPLHLLLDLIKCLYIKGRWISPDLSSTGTMHTTAHTARSSKLHIYGRQMDLPSQSSIYALHIARKLLYLDSSIQLSIYALHTTTPTARSNTMHTYRRQMDMPSQSSIDALHTTTATARCRSLQSIKHRCLAYHYTHCYI